MTEHPHTSSREADVFGRDFWRRTPTGDERLEAPTPALADPEFRRLADHLSILCWIARPDGRIVWYNRRWQDYCGANPEAREGSGWESVHDPVTLPYVEAEWKRAIREGQPFEMVLSLRGADGRFRPFLTRVSPFRDASGEVARWFGVNTEIGAQVRAERALSASEAKFDDLADAMPQMVWSTRSDGLLDYYNLRWYEFTGAPRGSTDGEGWAETVHADDRARTWTRWRRSLATGEPYEIEYRLRHHSGEYRWILGRALPVRDADNRIIRWIGTCTDIHDAKLAAEHNELLSRELSHRIKNIFAVIVGLVGLTARREPAMKPYAKTLAERIAALGRAHEFARPHSERSRPSNGQGRLLGMLGDLLSPYPAMQEGRLTVRGDDAAVDDRGATPIALVVHELATNAAKYGALSNDTGRVDVESRREGDRLTLSWRERGGPPVDGAPRQEGFGGRLLEMSVEQQLGGRLERRWRPEGLDLELGVAVSRLAREDATAA